MNTIHIIEDSILMFEQSAPEETKREFIIISDRITKSLPHTRLVLEQYGWYAEFKQQHPVIAAFMESKEVINIQSVKFSSYG